MPVSPPNAFLVAREFLRAYPAGLTIGNIGPRIGVPQSSVYEIARWLRYHRALSRRDGLWAADPHRLLGLMADLRRPSVVPRRTERIRLEPVAASLLLQQAQIPFTWSFLTAANHHVFIEPADRFQLLVPRSAIRNVAETLPSGPILLEIFEGEPSPAETTTTADGFPVTNRLRTAIDVRAHPEGGLHADALERALTARGASHAQA